LIRAGLALVLCLLPAFRAAAEAGAARPELRVLAAASLSEVVSALAAHFDEATIVASLGASSELARQAADGAPGDVFLSASPEWVEHLRERGALQGSAQVFAGNQIVCVAPVPGPLASAGVRDAAALAAHTRPDDRIALADVGVPAGEYTRESLARQGVLAALAPRIVGLKDVRAVLHAVETGEVVAGFVYATDARVSKLGRLFALDPSTHAPIAYPAALLRQSTRPGLARRFVDFLRSEVARKLLLDAGFSVP